MRFTDEIIAVKMDGSKSVQRFAHTHTIWDGCYRCEAHGVPAPDGRRVLWASNWTRNCTTCGTSNDIKAYVADARPAAVAGAPALAPWVGIADAGSSTEIGGSIKSYAFDFGDGAKTGAQSASQAPHTFAAGTWTVRATVTDPLGASTTATQTIVVADTSKHAPIASLSVTPASGTSPLPVTADASASQDLDGLLSSYRFDFGDGTVVSSSSPIVTHTYATGAWKGSVIVTDATGLADTVSPRI